MERLAAHIKTLTGWTNALIPFARLADDRAVRKARLLVMFYVTTAGFLAVFAGLYHYIDYGLGVGACLYGAAVVPLLLAVFRRTGSFGVTTAVFDINAILMFAVLIYGTGGTHSAIVPWLAIVPASGFVFAGWRRGLLMTAVCLAEIVTLMVLEANGIHLPKLFDQDQTWLLNVAVQVGLVAYICMILMVYEGSSARTIKLLDRLNADLVQRRQEVEQQREELANRNARIAEINASLEVIVASRTQKLEQARSELDTFLYEAAHALRRPMASIMGLMTIVRAETDPEVAATMHDHIDASLAHMDQMLRKLIIVSELNERKLDTQVYLATDRIAAVVATRAAEIQAAGAELVIDVALTVQVAADRFLLDLVVALLLDNALQYTVKTGRKPAITIAAYTAMDGTTVLRVQDNGIGIPASEIGRVTEMFFRATAKVSGSGLGLYVVQKALDGIGGSLRIQSELHVGTLVEVHLPSKIAAADEK